MLQGFKKNNKPSLAAVPARGGQSTNFLEKRKLREEGLGLWGVTSNISGVDQLPTKKGRPARK